MTEFDLAALEKALSTKKRVKKETQEPKKGRDEPLFVPVDNKGKEVKPEDIKVGKTYKLRKNK